MNSEIILTIDDGIAYLKVNRPRELNALTRKIVDEMDNAIELIENNDDVRVLVIGSDKNFAAGAEDVYKRQMLLYNKFSGGSL